MEQKQILFQLEINTKASETGSNKINRNNKRLEVSNIALI